MEKYQRIKQIGRGSYGVVWKAKNLQNGEVVAIKKLMNERFNSMEECMKLREVKALLRMKNHPNFVKLIEVVRENSILFMVFEYMEGGSLFNKMIRTTNPFSETEIRNLCFQVFQGLAYMHDTVGYFHRDLKPENLLVSKDVIKIADLGQARRINGGPPYTDYVTTRWYRAPEVLLSAEIYDSSVDMWAMGAIMFELFTLRPLFQGASSAGVLDEICSVIGSPTETTWSLGLYFAGMISYQFPEFPGVDLSTLLPSASPEAVDLITKLVSWNPCWRPTAEEVLEHPFFHGCYQLPPMDGKS
ncbi:cyclin-dependent kinase F-4-like [Cynara cardunculus var. scolymus]|uniref:cyclin-dependent kinase F-4-like n=1 Tax=Cynara cardunculus var. scolymus TaxID=59895 RepID=UPI000D6258B7|nr:cyclin-dependent kinase F-4-like [Cynara cardunculus var. scolymus]